VAVARRYAFLPNSGSIPAAYESSAKNGDPVLRPLPPRRGAALPGTLQGFDAERSTRFKDVHTHRQQSPVDCLPCAGRRRYLVINNKNTRELRRIAGGGFEGMSSPLAGGE
jgi:hypothetical protein